jgi:hypothetical protein
LGEKKPEEGERKRGEGEKKRVQKEVHPWGWRGVRWQGRMEGRWQGRMDVGGSKWEVWE